MVISIFNDVWNHREPPPSLSGDAFRLKYCQLEEPRDMPPATPPVRRVPCVRLHLDTVRRDISPPFLVPSLPNIGFASCYDGPFTFRN